MNYFFQNIVNKKTFKNSFFKNTLNLNDEIIIHHVNTWSKINIQDNNKENDNNNDNKEMVNEKNDENENEDDLEIITDINTILRINNKMDDSDYIILSNLSLLTKINKNQKIFVETRKQDKIIDFELKIDDSMILNLSRWYHNQCRYKTINKINVLIEKSLIQYDLHKNNNNKLMIKEYDNIFQKIPDGLNNLKNTYKDDILIVNELSNIINTISNI